MGAMKKRKKKDKGMMPGMMKGKKGGKKKMPGLGMGRGSLQKGEY